MGRAAARAFRIGIGLMGLACGDAPAPAAPDATTPVPPATYAGAEACVGCHAEEAERWRGSHHDLAMQEASPQTVLGDFSGVSFEHRGQRFEFARRDDRFLIRTAGADGALREFEVAYTFGVEPLQQYLVTRPGGRLHAVSAAWDARPAADGGQRWFSLHDEAVPPGDVLHWTGLAGSWNAMCADCHSTNVATGYELENDVYAPTWSAPDVSCEACHGPASAHLAWAEAGAPADHPLRGLSVDLARPHAWEFVDGGRIAERVPAATDVTEIETCAPCHARRSRIADAVPGAPFLDGYRPALLDPGLYHPDGQIQDEVYVWGSFVQSRMYAVGVTCSDCHDPHALRIEEPDAVCARCHRSEVFATPEHHHHEAGRAGASCVACHMPARTYMGVDARRDHGFRIPRPDLSLAIGVPNACTGCHGDRDAAWAADATTRWFGDRSADAPHFGQILEAGRRRDPGAAAALAGLSRDRTQPAIVRATALRWLAGPLDATSAAALFDALADDDGLVRMAAAGAAQALSPQDQIVSLVPLLADPLRAVRIEAGRVLAPLHARITNPRERLQLEAALAEYRASQNLQADRPEAHTNLGILHARQGVLAAARRDYETALRVGPHFLPAYANLAELHRQQGDEDAAERVLRLALEREPDFADGHHALGLLLVRRQRTGDALAELARAAELAPETPRYAYVFGIALDAAGEKERALALLETAHRAHPGDAELLLALATLHRDAGRTDAALEYAKRLLALRPEDPSARALVGELEAR